MSMIEIQGRETGTSRLAFSSKEIGLDRNGSAGAGEESNDQAASIEQGGLIRLTRDARVIVYESERPLLEKLRRHPS